METFDNLSELLRQNDCDSEEVCLVIHNTFRMMILRKICRAMNENAQVRNNVLRTFRRTRDNAVAAAKVAEDLAGVRLPEMDSQWLSKCLRAYFKKAPRRKEFDYSTKERQLAKQGGLCACCGRMITSGHYDHIIPWELVGDELEDNYQMLCGPCNEHKSNRVDYMFERLLMKR